MNRAAGVPRSHAHPGLELASFQPTLLAPVLARVAPPHGEMEKAVWCLTGPGDSKRRD
jgi:hypothetical protein